MALTPLHSAVGIAIVSIISNPLISIPICILSHVFLDRYPKWYDETKSNSNVAGIASNIFKDSKVLCLAITEVILALLVIYVLFHAHSWILLLGVIAANLLDIWDAVNVLFKRQEFWFCHPSGWFPKKVTNWQGFKMSAVQTATLDFIFVVLILIPMLRN